MGEALKYPADIDVNPEYGYMMAIFKPRKYNDSQASPSKEQSAASIPANAVSGDPVTSTEDPKTGAFTPIGVLNSLAYSTVQNVGGLTQFKGEYGDYVVLYVPEDAGTSYNAQWEDENFPVAGHVLDAGEAATQKIKSLIQGGEWGSMSRIFSAIGNAGAAYAMKQAAAVPGANEFFRRAGVAPNPKKQMIFKDMEFRQFQFSYMFFAKNPQEVTQIQRIIYTFKKAMHPEVGGILGQGSFLYAYPDEFEIEYVIKEKGNFNPFMHKFKRCALIGMDVKYAPQGVFVTHADGSPTSIQMTLRFRELDILTRPDFASAEDTF